MITLNSFEELSTSDNDRLKWVQYYVTQLGLTLVPNGPGMKSPPNQAEFKNWNKDPKVYLGTVERAQTFYTTHPEWNVGVLHSKSGTCCIDIDNLELTKKAFSQVLSIDLEEWEQQYPHVRSGREGSRKYLFQLPEDFAPASVKIARPADQAKKTASVTAFELRTGANQDVLPPSTHPSGTPYTWNKVPTALPPLPAAILAAWQYWERYKPEFELVCFDKAPEIKPPERSRLSRKAREIIAACNDHVDLVQVLLVTGKYQQVSATRFLYNGSSTRQAGVIIYAGRGYSHHAGDPLHGLFDAFQVIRVYEHGGDFQKALHAVADSLGIPWGATQFEVTDGYLYRLIKSKEGLRREKVSRQIDVIFRVRDVRDENWGIQVSFQNGKGKLMIDIIPVDLLHDTRALRDYLSKRYGFEIAHGKHGDLVEYLTDCMHECDSFAISAERTGWVGEAYVLPKRVFGNPQGEPISFVSENSPYSQQGSLAEWKENVARLCVGNTQLVFVVGLGLSAVLMRPMRIDSGGFHFTGASSQGKTTLAKVMCSLLGAWPEYHRTWRATSNGLEILAREFNDGALILDEISQAKPYEIGQCVYMLGNEVGKTRMTAKTRLQDALRWRLFFLSTGEKSLEDYLREAKLEMTAGLSVRMVNIPAVRFAHGVFACLHEHADGAALAEALHTATSKYYGTPLMAFLEQVFARGVATVIPSLNEQIRAFEETVLAPHVAVSGQVKRVVHRFAHVAACGELATELGITGWPVGESLKAAADCFQAWIEDRGGVADNLEDVKAIAQVREFFQRHGSSRFPPLLTIQDGRIQINTADKTHNRAGFQMAAGGKTEFLVFPEVYKKEICSGFEWRKFTRLLLATGLLIPDKDEPRKAQSRHTVPGHGRIRLYHFAAEVLGKDD